MDDDKDDRELFEEAFSELNSANDLKLFKDGLELMDFLDKAEDLPDIIFLDLSLQIMRGLETLRKIRKNERYKMLSVAIYSTSYVEKDIEEALIAGANVYINKPSNFLSLKEIIGRVIKINWQYASSDLNRDTFVFVV